MLLTALVCPFILRSDFTETEYGEKFEYRALMVIKTTEKTMAKQRKGAISNWKVPSILHRLTVLPSHLSDNANCTISINSGC